MAKLVPKRVQTCFERFLGRHFRKSFFAQCSLEGREIEKFLKKSDRSKFLRLLTGCYVKRLNEKFYLEKMKKNIMIILPIHLQKKCFGVNVILEYQSLRIKVWWTSFNLFAEKCSKCYSLLYIRYGMSKKGETSYKRSCQSVSSIWKTDYVPLKTSYMDESACLWKHLKWNKFTFSGDRLSGKFRHRDKHRQRECLRKSLKRN